MCISVESVTYLENIVYLDNSSTTPVCEKAQKEIYLAVSRDFGNPSSLHVLGFNAEKRVSSARSLAADMIGAAPSEVYFTSGGTEGNNTALFGAAYARKKRGRKIVTTAIEHPSVAEPIKRLQEEGFTVVRIKPESDGTVSKESIFNAIDENTILVSIMLVNNETGAVLPVSAAREAIEKTGAPAILHCDAVQAFGKIPINVNKLGADIITVSAHKIHGPKGAGFIYIKKGITVKPFILGGGQEKGFRSGTEAVPAICGMYGAMKAIGDINENCKRVKELRDFAASELTNNGIAVINSPDSALPYVLNISVEGYRSETLLHFLENEGVFVSSGSACAKGKGSYVLGEMGLPRRRIDSALRISFSRFNTKDDVICLISAIERARAVLRRVK
ncbi:MAG: cysteine desulfurase [Clostridia bacterium]|nr:cysteine desulfurase [Clostridia bacterium]